MPTLSIDVRYESGRRRYFRLDFERWEEFYDFFHALPTVLPYCYPHARNYHVSTVLNNSNFKSNNKNEI